MRIGWLSLTDDVAPRRRNIQGLVNVKGTLVIPDSLTAVDQCGFYKIGASKIEFGDGLSELGWLAFGLCENLKEINIPKNLTEISKSAFDSDHKLDTITSEPGTARFRAVNNVIYTNDMKELTLYPGGLTAESFIVPEGVEKIVCMGVNRNLKSITLQDGVKEIDESAFGSMYGLESIKLPDTLERIGNSGFIYCYALQSLELPESMKTIATDAFYGCGALNSISIKSRDCKFAVISAPGTAVISGYRGSSAEAYADRAGYEFKNIESGAVVFGRKGNKELMKSLHAADFEVSEPIANGLVTIGYIGSDTFLGYQASDSLLWKNTSDECKRSIKAKTDKLCRDKSSDIAKARAIYDHLAGIRKYSSSWSIENAWSGEGADNSTYTELMNAMLMYAGIPYGLAYKNTGCANVMLCDGGWILADVNSGHFNEAEETDSIKVVIVRSGDLVYAADDFSGFKLNQIGILSNKTLNQEISNRGIDIPNWISGYYYSWRSDFPDIEIRGTRGTVAEDIVKDIGYQDVKYSGSKFIAHRYEQQTDPETPDEPAVEDDEAQAKLKAAQKAYDDAKAAYDAAVKTQTEKQQALKDAEARWDKDKSDAAAEVEEAQAVLNNIGVSFMDSKAGTGNTAADWNSWLRANMKDKSFSGVSWNSYFASEDFDKAFYDPLSYDNLMRAADLVAEGNVLRKSQNQNLSELKMNYRMMMVSVASNSMSSKVVGHVLYKDSDFKNSAIFGNSGGKGGGENISWGAEDPFMGWYYEEKIHWLADQNGTNAANVTDAMITQVENEAKANGHDFEAYYSLYYGNRSNYLSELNSERSSASYSTGHYTNLINNSWKSAGLASNTKGTIYYGICHTNNFSTSEGDVTPTQFKTELSTYAASANKALSDAKAKADQLKNKPSYVTNAENELAEAEADVAARKTALDRAAEELERVKAEIADPEGGTPENHNDEKPENHNDVTPQSGAASGSQTAAEAAAEAEFNGIRDSSIPAVKGAKAKAGKKSITISWKKAKKNSKKFEKVEIQCSKNRSFPRAVTSVKVVKKTKTSLRIKKLSKKKVYYVRVRYIKYVNGEKHVSKWSKVKKVKTK